MISKKMKFLTGIITVFVGIVLVFPSIAFGGADSGKHKHYYNRKLAYEWARNNALKRRPYDKIAARRCPPSDCACFTSSALYNGGWIMRKGKYWNASYWWKRKENKWRQHSNAWAMSNYLSTFINKRDRGYKMKITPNMLGKAVRYGWLRKGDVIQYTNEGKNTKEHSMVVTRVEKNGGNVFCEAGCRLPTKAERETKKIIEDTEDKKCLKKNYDKKRGIHYRPDRRSKKKDKKEKTTPVCVSYHSTDIRNASLKRIMKDDDFKNRTFYLQHIYKGYDE